MVGKIAGGLSLFALGLLFYGERPSFNIQTCTNIGIKNLIQPIMMLNRASRSTIAHAYTSTKIQAMSWLPTS